jgi:hypothetical protein
MKTRKGNVVDDQKFVWFPAEENEPRLSSKEPFAGLESTYLDALPRDVSVHVMPIGGTSQARKNFAVRVEPDDEAFEQIIATGLEQRSSYRAELSPAACNFFQQVASRMVRGGGAAYEVVLLRDKDSGEPIGFDLFGIDIGSLEFKRNTIIQIVPQEWAIEHKLPTRIEVDRRKVVVFWLPPEFRDLSEIKEALKQLGGAALMRMYEAAQGEKDLGYDAKVHIRAEHLALAAATRYMGWTAGQSLSQLFTEYYVVHRRLVFERTIISLRDCILRTLNQSLCTISAAFNKVASLRIEGLPTREDVERAMSELSTGSRTFASVLDDFSLL